ncbi:choice-of-anchor A family protein [Agromyces sp. CFH 90414]|uniref:Choice-of-anchor A family protein n=1 Tax=Agromyces agglutinans TaxID=2662258 RepID=A0A6I2FGH1_9MICO|nr:choice-of-anchor A family protein [Agromyces agglutinans]MRG60048.1 choice-of-anchor A family protein [Agromyces agglutinans]
MQAAFSFTPGTTTARSIGTTTTSRSRPRRLRSLIGTLAAASLALSGGFALAIVAPAAPASAAVPAPFCPPDGGMPDIGPLPTYTDANVAVFAGDGLFVVEQRAEIEGLVLVTGDADIDKDPDGLLNVGSVGAGSGIVPPPGDPMFQVGGDLVVQPGNRIEVGAGIDGGGAVLAGGSIGGEIATNGAPATGGLGQTAAMAPNQGFQSVIDAASAELASEPSTGSTAVTGNTVSFTGTGTTDLEVFSISAAELAAATTVDFAGLSPEGPLVVNVFGAGAVSWAPNYFAIDGVRVDGPSGPGFGNAAARILWNFADTTDLDLLGTSQVMGSILAPGADAFVTASTNGRLHVGGDLTLGGAGAGAEHHNYPWNGGGGLGCGGFSAQKVVTGDGATLVPADTEFTLHYSYSDAEGQPVEGTLTLLADGTVAHGPRGIPDGTEVTFAEIDLPEVPGVTWGVPVIEPSTIVIGDGATARVTVTNTAETAGEVGGFAIRKEVTGAAATLVPTNTSFSVGFSYEQGGETVTGSLDVPADGSLVAGPQDLPAGTVVSFTEAALPPIAGVVWGEPTIDPATLTVAADQVVTVTVTNTASVAPPTPTPSPTPPAPPTPPSPSAPDEIAETGASGVGALFAAAVFTFAAGAVATAFARRRRIRVSD